MKKVNHGAHKRDILVPWRDRSRNAPVSYSVEGWCKCLRTGMKKGVL